MIRVDISKCTGCKRCESVCAFFHTGKVNNHLARIKVLNLYETGLDSPVVCAHCKEQYCMCCPDEALSIGSLGQVIVSPTNCTLCNACEKGCPIGAIEIFNDVVYVCDLCGGNPRCVEVCTEGAITFEPERDEDRPSLANFKKNTSRMSPGQKRQYYLKKTGSIVRDKWREKHA